MTDPGAAQSGKGTPAGTPTETPAPENQTGEFEIQNGILLRYNGPGGDVAVPAGVTEIGERAFFACTSLTGIELPDSVAAIDKQAFYGCVSLVAVGFPNGLTEIGGQAFYSCVSLPGIALPSSVAEIGDSAFANCISLVDLALQNSAAMIGDSAFSETQWLENQTEEFVILGSTLLKYNGPGGSVVVPDGVKRIGAAAFSDRDSMIDEPVISIELPAGLTEIGAAAFSDCYSLMGMELPAGVTKIGERAFFGCASLTTVEIPESATEIGDSAFSSSLWLENQAEEFVIVNGILLQYNGPGGNVVIPDGLTEIGERAFADCLYLANVDIPASVTKSGDFPFFTPDNFTFRCPAGSYAEQWAKKFYYWSDVTIVTY